MRARAHHHEARPLVERDVSLHALVRVEANLGDAHLACAPVGKVEQCPSVAETLPVGSDGDAVDQQMVRLSSSTIRPAIPSPSPRSQTSPRSIRGP